MMMEKPLKNEDCLAHYQKGDLHHNKNQISHSYPLPLSKTQRL